MIHSTKDATISANMWHTGRVVHIDQSFSTHEPQPAGWAAELAWFTAVVFELFDGQSAFRIGRELVEAFSK